MNKFTKVSLAAVAASILVTGCAQKVRIKALNPAEVGAMASKKKVAVTAFKNDSVGLSGKIEAEIAKQKLDKKRYFTVLSRKNLNKIIAEQKLQSSEMMNETTAVKVGKGIGAQAIISGEVASANAESGSYKEDREKCLQYYKDGSGCAQYRYYKVTCKTTQASVSANINIVDVQNATVIYGDTITKDYSGDSCKASTPSKSLTVGSLLNVLTQAVKSPTQILSKSQALNMLAGKIANEFVYKLTPNYVYFNVTLLDSIELDTATDAQKEKFAAALEYIKATRYDKAKKLLGTLMDELDGKSYAVAYVYGVVFEATGNLNKAKEMYSIADDDTIKPVDEINEAMNRINSLIEKREEAKKQMNAK